MTGMKGKSSEGKVEITLDRFIIRREIKFRRFPEKIKEPVIGYCSSYCKNSSFKTSTDVTTFKGKMSSIYLFNKALEQNHFRCIRELGFDYNDNFEKSSTEVVAIDTASSSRSREVKKATTDERSIFQNDVLMGSIILAFNPLVSEDDYFGDNTPKRNKVKWQVDERDCTNPRGGISFSGSDAANEVGVEPECDIIIDRERYILDTATKSIKMNAKRLPGSYRSTKKDVRTELESLGGIKCLFPIFLQFDQKRSVRHQVFDEGKLKKLEIVDTTWDENICITMMQLIKRLIDTNVSSNFIFSLPVIHKSTHNKSMHQSIHQSMHPF